MDLLHSAAFSRSQSCVVARIAKHTEGKAPACPDVLTKSRRQPPPRGRALKGNRMTSKRSILFLFAFSILLTACGAQATPAPAPTSTDVPVTFTPSATLAPTLTPTSTPTPVPPTPTFGPPLAIANLIVTDSKCVVIKPTITYPRYRVEIIFYLAWQDLSENEDGFWLYRDGNRVAELPPNTTAYVHTFDLIKGGRTSTFFIVAYNSAGQTKSELLSHRNPC